MLRRDRVAGVMPLGQASLGCFPMTSREQLSGYCTFSVNLASVFLSLWMLFCHFCCCCFSGLHHSQRQGAGLRTVPAQGAVPLHRRTGRALSSFAPYYFIRTIERQHNSVREELGLFYGYPKSSSLRTRTGRTPSSFSP